MLVVLNDIAFKFKFPDKFVAINKMKELIELVIELKKCNSSFRINACHRLFEVELAEGYYLSQLFSEPQDVFGRKYQTALKTFFLNPNVIESGKGKIEYKGIRSGQCAAAFENGGFLLSIMTDDLFEKESILCNYCVSEKEVRRQVTINNLSKKMHLEIHKYKLPIRKYEFNPKHKVNGGWGSKMDLPDDIAQILLNNAVVANTDPKHLIAKYNGNYYSFRCHWDIFYHGYRDDSMPQNLKNKLDNTIL